MAEFDTRASIYYKSYELSLLYYRDFAIDDDMKVTLRQILMGIDIEDVKDRLDEIGIDVDKRDLDQLELALDSNEEIIKLITSITENHF